MSGGTRGALLAICLSVLVLPWVTAHAFLVIGGYVRTDLPASLLRHPDARGNESPEGDDAQPRPQTGPP